MNLIKKYQVYKIKKKIMDWYLTHQLFTPAYLAPTLEDFIEYGVVLYSKNLIEEALHELVKEDKLVYMLESYYLKGYEPKL